MHRLKKWKKNNMKNKKSDKKGEIRKQVLLIATILISIIGLIVIVSALTTEEQNALQNELNKLNM